MTDAANAIDQAERIRRLQERRAASGRAPRAAAPRAELQGPEAGERPAAAPGRPRPRGRHPAAATRWLLGGLSVASFFTIAGTVAVANVGSGTAAQPAQPAPAAAQAAAAPLPTAAPTATAPPPTVAPIAVAPPPSVNNVSAPAPSAIPTAPAPAPHTTTRGS